MKLAAALMLLSGAVLFIYMYGRDKFDEGYTKAAIDHEIAVKKEFSELSQKYKVLMSQKIDAERKAEQKINELLQADPKTEIITKKVIKYVENTDCKRLGNDFVGLFNDIHASKE